MPRLSAPLLIALIYLALGAVWLLGAGHLADGAVDAPLWQRLADGREWVLLVVTSAMLYLVVRYWTGIAAHPSDTADSSQGESLRARQEIGQGVTERTGDVGAADARLALQYTVLSEIALGGEIDRTLHNILRRSCSGLGMDVAAVWWPEGSGDRLVCGDIVVLREGAYEPFVQMSRTLALRPGEGLPGRVWAMGSSRWIEELPEEPHFPRARAAAESGLHTAIGFAIRHQGHIRGVIELHTERRLPPNESLLDVLDLLGLQLGLFIALRQAEAERVRDLALVEEAQRMAQLGHWVWNPADNHLTWSQRVYEICGYKEGELDPYIEQYLELTHPDDRDGIRQIMADLVAGKSIALEHRIIRRDGAQRHVMLRGQPVYEHGKPVRATGFIQDITERKQVELRLRQSEQWFALVFRETPIASVIKDAADDQVLEANNALLKMIGYEAAEVIGKRSVELGLWASPGQREEVLALLREQSFIENLPLQLRRKDGRVLETVHHARLVEHEGRLAVLDQILDVTERNQLERDLTMAASALAHTGEAVAMSDPEHRLIYVNRAFTRDTGYALEDVKGKPAFEVLHMSTQRHGPEIVHQIQECLRSRDHWHGEIWTRRKSGEVYPQLLSLSAVRNERGDVTHHIAVSNDISRFKEHEQRLQFLAYHDSLTGLPNRALLQDRCNHAMEQAGRYGHLVAVLYLDLDRFKLVNDTFGHLTGDILLQEVACRMQESVRSSDTVSRLGGDEFVVLLERVSERQEVTDIAEKLIERIAQPFMIEGQQISTSTSIGIALYPAHADQAKDLISRADEALYQAKQKGRNTYRVFDE